MDSGSHSLTLGRLYAWEKKLYEEVKVIINQTMLFLFCFFFFLGNDGNSLLVSELLR